MPADAFVNAYWEIPIRTVRPDGAMVQFFVSVNRYLMNVIPTDLSVNAERVRTQQREVRHMINQSNMHHYRTPSPGLVQRVRVGKGLPSEIVSVLTAGVHSGILPGTMEGLQLWVDHNIGVDCTGFASAYFVSTGRMTLHDATNAGCGYFFDAARRYHRVSGTNQSVAIWDIDQIQPDDVILWMYENGQESKRPGHIGVIYSVTGNMINYAESSGENDGAGHFGPRLNHKMLQGPGTHRPRYFELGSANSKVIIVRPFSPYSFFT